MMVDRKKIKKIVVIFLGCLILNGCGTKIESNVEYWKNILRQPLKLDKDTSREKQDSNKIPDEQSEITDQPKIAVKLYFINEDQQLVVEKREINKAVGLARKTLEELIAGPQNEGNYPVFPAKTSLQDINIKEDGLCVLDFSQEIKNIADAQQEKLLLKAVLKTLSQFESIERVTFMVEGEPVSTLGGKVKFAAEIEINESF